MNPGRTHPGIRLPEPGGLRRPPGPPVREREFLMILTPTISTLLIHNLKSKLKNFEKLKKFAPTKKMKCDNNSIYELQDGIYGSQVTPWHAL